VTVPALRRAKAVVARAGVERRQREKVAKLGEHVIA
jgi:hypothetical protein